MLRSKTPPFTVFARSPSPGLLPTYSSDSFSEHFERPGQFICASSRSTSPALDVAVSFSSPSLSQFAFSLDTLPLDTVAPPLSIASPFAQPIDSDSSSFWSHFSQHSLSQSDHLGISHQLSFLSFHEIASPDSATDSGDLSTLNPKQGRVRALSNASANESDHFNSSSGVLTPGKKHRYRSVQRQEKEKQRQKRRRRFRRMTRHYPDTPSSGKFALVYRGKGKEEDGSDHNCEVAKELTDCTQTPREAEGRKLTRSEDRESEAHESNAILPLPVRQLSFHTALPSNLLLALSVTPRSATSPSAVRSPILFAASHPYTVSLPTPPLLPRSTFSNTLSSAEHTPDFSLLSRAATPAFSPPSSHIYHSPYDLPSSLPTGTDGSR
ncbi:hypothetical protein BLNAU_14123 [Blattamonas nauphoetae]|uniref:Uncharacterized protein n=1 Tax=Blattamonas nauphoetae TaxID=2049346 RepID=A0ABQ9XEN5_9EUKA|nr:hypothetical protein BLNAU_14123 [Blattamonas nauphoetae]